MLPYKMCAARRRKTDRGHEAPCFLFSYYFHRQPAFEALFV